MKYVLMFIAVVTAMFSIPFISLASRGELGAALAQSQLPHVNEKSNLPWPAMRISDATGTLTKDQIGQLVSKSKGIADSTKAELLAVIVPSLNGESIEEYSGRLFSAWKPGRPDVYDAAILVIAKNDRKMRIEVGRGLEGSLTDYDTKDILGAMKPNLKKGDFSGAISVYLDRAGSKVAKDLVPVSLSLQPTATTRGSIVPWPLVAVMGVLVTGTILLFLFWLVGAFPRKQKLKTKSSPTYPNLDSKNFHLQLKSNRTIPMPSPTFTKPSPSVSTAPAFPKPRVIDPPPPSTYTKRVQEERRKSKSNSSSDDDGFITGALLGFGLGSSSSNSSSSSSSSSSSKPSSSFFSSDSSDSSSSSSFSSSGSDYGSSGGGSSSDW